MATGLRGGPVSGAQATEMGQGLTALQEVVLGVALLIIGLVAECAIDVWRERHK